MILKKNIWIDNYLYKWIFSPNELSFEEFLAVDDIRLNYHLSKWKDEAPRPISTLCELFINRDLLKATNISFLSNIKKLELLAFARQKAESNNFDPALFCGIKEKKFNGFESNNSLKVWDNNLLKDLDNESELIKTLMKSNENSLIVYPKFLKKEILERILILKNN